MSHRLLNKPRHLSKSGGCATRSAPSIEPIEPRLLFATFTVTTIDDSGAGSLRQAITSANATQGADEIEFNIGAGLRTINLTSALSAITEAVFIQGANEALPTQVIELNGAGAGAGASGLTITGDGTVVNVLVINRFRGPGVSIAGDFNTIFGCRIGVAATSDAPLGNLGAGIAIAGGENSSVVGSTIAFNGGDGISIAAGAGGGHEVAGNRLFANGESSIDLGADGVTPNDGNGTGGPPDDADSGPNDLQNYPLLTSLTFQGDGDAVIAGEFHSTANTAFQILFYATPVAAREGRQFLVDESGGGTLQVMTDANGDAAFTFVARLEGGAPLGQQMFVTATATDNTRFNTSEFSPPVGVVAAPRVQQVFVDGAGWTPAGRAALAVAGLGTSFGFAVPGGATQFAAVPYTGIDRVRIRFTEGVSVQQDDLAIRGVNQATYTTNGFVYDAGTFTATWTLATPVGNDKIVLDLDGDLASAVTDVSGNRLDGEWADGADAYPSGNGAAGGDFRFRVHVLSGDADGNGSVTVADVGIVSTHFGQLPRGPREGDFNGDGTVSVADVGVLSTNFGRSLPAGTPTVVAPSASGSAVARASASSATSLVRTANRPRSLLAGR